MSEVAVAGNHADVRSPRDLVVDAGAFAMMGAVLFWLPTMAGGRTPAGLAGLGLIAVLATPAALRGVATTSRTERLLLGWLGLALLLHPLVAGYRDELDQSLLRYAGVPMVYLVARYVWSRWTALMWGVLPIAAIWWWSRGIAGWLSPHADDPFAAWRILPWHNPSGIAMGAFAVVGVTRWVRDRRSVWLLAAGLCLSGLVLSGSRGSIALTTLALGVVVVRNIGREGAPRRLLVVTAACALVTAALLTLGGDSGARDGAVVPPQPPPESTRDGADGVDVGRSGDRGSASQSFGLRLHNMAVAWRMFTDRPIAGTGLGSYSWYVLDLTSPTTHFTRSAHNEPLEVLGEGGLLVGVPFGLLFVGALAGAARDAVRRPSGDRMGPATASALLLLHFLFDIDWVFIVVPALSAILLAASRASPGRPADPRLARFVVAALVLPILIGLGVVGLDVRANVRGEAPTWGAREHVDAAVEDLLANDIDAARREAHAAAADAPADATVAGLVAAVDAVGTGDAVALRAQARDGSIRVAALAIVGLATVEPSSVPTLAAALRDRIAEYHESLYPFVLDDLDAAERAARQRMMAS